MSQTNENGLRQTIDGVERVFYDGYWIKYYQPPEDNLADKKRLIQSLTRRLFNHMEHGINIPGRLVDEIRAAYEAEQDPHKKRVKGAMLAGALFNRAADIFNQLVEMEASGIKIESGNELRRICGECLQEALEFGKMVKHRNGDEGIDELWGEPFKAFAMPIEDFYQSRYIKIAMTMRNIDEVAEFMVDCLAKEKEFEGMQSLILDYAAKARRKCETLRTDDDLFDVWSDFVVAGEAILECSPAKQARQQMTLKAMMRCQLLEKGVRLISNITRARTSMPKSSENYRSACQLLKTSVES